MKVKTLCASALLAVLGVSTIGTTVFAADGSEAAKQLTGTGTVKVEEGTTDPTVDPVPNPTDPTKPLDPDKEKPTPSDSTNDNKGPLSITRVTNLDFGTVKTSSKDVTEYAKGVTWAPKDGTTEAGSKLGNYVVFSDIRSDASGYTVKAALTQQFTGKDSGSTLDNSTITFTNGKIFGTSSESNGAPTAESSFTIADSNAVLVATAGADQGKGTYMVEYGHKDAEAGTDTTDESVQLKIPGATASKMTKDTYTAVITWTIEAAGGNANNPSRGAAE